MVTEETVGGWTGTESAQAALIEHGVVEGVEEERHVRASEQTLVSFVEVTAEFRGGQKKAACR